MKILAFDLGTKSGWAFGAPGWRRAPDAGLVRLPRTGEDIGRFAHAFRAEARALIERFEPDIVGFESPYLPATRFNPVTRKPELATNITTLRKLYTIAGVLELVCADYKIRCVEEHIPTIKKAVTGNGRATKERMIPAAESFGLVYPAGLKITRSEDEREHLADAFGVWLCVARAVASGEAAQIEPLWVAGRGAA
ncbi:hypothetical protein E5163_14820 [Marinicauda algicola]|uniref:DUF429 domain-containing protein n=1 Tax=Marinicauda algicola TaxID=2029849 RepID=A0A4S2GWS7_9PROT|nr:crossover junction endodeoxyribonuclease RuvC [Marinicauda algicola]TGY87338.1 hypothetical protein E5163_14820 [Marinicauda algicola]